MGYDKKYIEHVDKTLRQVMYEKPGARDWTQFSLSVRDVMLAAGTIYGSFTDEQKHNLFRLLQEIIRDYVIVNLCKYDIVTTEKIDNDDKQ